MAEDAQRQGGDVSGSVAGPPPGRQDVFEEDDPLTQVAAMSIEELRSHLPLAQNHLDAIEAELEELWALRDSAIIRLTAMHARLMALAERDTS